MPRVTRGPRNSVNDRPGRLRLLLRRQKRLLRPAGWVAFAAVVVLLGRARSCARPHPAARWPRCANGFGGATAFAGLRVTDVVIEGRANTPEPLLRAALGVSKGDPILGFSVEQARAARRDAVLGGARHGRAPAARHRRGVPAGAPSVRHLAEPGQVRADRPRRPGRRQRGRRANFRQLPLVVGPGAPAAAAALIDALTDRPELQKRVVAAVRVGERRWNLRLNNGADVMLPEGHEVAGARSADAACSRTTRCSIARWPRSTCGCADRLVLRPRPDPAAPRDAGKKPT